MLSCDYLDPEGEITENSIEDKEVYVAYNFYLEELGKRTEKILKKYEKLTTIKEELTADQKYRLWREK